MPTKSKTVLLLIAAVAVFAISASSVFAQSGNNPPPTPGTPEYGWQGMMGYRSRGLMGMGSWMMWDDDMSSTFSAVATALGIDQQTLVSEMQPGKTIVQLAHEKGIDLATIWSAAQSEMQEHLKALFEAGVLTQAQADTHLSYMRDHWDDMPMFTGQGFGMMSGGMRGNNFHHGMMGFNG